jgi:hypothetical protein
MRQYSDTPNAKRSSLERAPWHAFKRTPKRAGRRWILVTSKRLARRAPDAYLGRPRGLRVGAA